MGCLGVRGIAMWHLWDSYVSMGLRCGTYGAQALGMSYTSVVVFVSVAFCCRTCGMSMGYLWDAYGIFMGYLWDVSGISMGCLWDTYGVSMGYLRGTFGMSMGYLWDVYVHGADLYDLWGSMFLRSGAFGL